MLDQAGVGTVVHTDREADPAGLRSLLTRVCERSRTVSRVVAASTTAVYGASRRDPAVFDRALPDGRAAPRARAARAAHEAEALVRTLARRRPDIAVSVLRLAPLDRPVGRQLADPLPGAASSPVRLGFDPRLQLLHESDAVEVLVHATRTARPRMPRVSTSPATACSRLSQLLRLAHVRARPGSACARGSTGWLHSRPRSSTRPG